MEQVHGKLDRLAEVDLSTTSMASVTVHYGITSFLEKIDTSLTLRDAKKFLAHLVGLNGSQIELFHQCNGSECGESPMSDQTRFLSSYGVKEGDALHIELKSKTGQKS